MDLAYSAYQTTQWVYGVSLGAGLTLYTSPQEALAGADVALVATEWPELRSLSADDFASAMRQARVIDQNHFLASALAGDARITYGATGRAA